MIEKIISGGQTGADRAALDVAIRHGVSHGGWCPRGRLAEDGPLDPRYQLQETPRSDPAERTEHNVVAAEGTVVFTLAPRATGGSLLTLQLAAAHRKPSLHIARSNDPDPVTALRDFIQVRQVGVLNVAGSPESEEPGIYDWVSRVLTALQSS